MLTKIGRCALAAAMLWLVFGAGGRAVADITITTPTGLSAGDTFRIVFVTDASTTATSTNIADYNTFVNNDAITQAGGPSNVVTYAGTTLTFNAIASTSSTDAIMNIGEHTTQNIPIYLASGTLVTSSDNTTSLWSGFLQKPIDQVLTGVTIDHIIWSGTALFEGPSLEPLGTSFSYVGISTANAVC